MDERQTQIKEGAGLEESRVNEELIEFLNKWSFPVLLLIAIVSGGYFVYNQYQVRKLRARDEAFAQLGNVESSANPSVFSLTAIADEFEGVGSVSELALLRAAEIHLNAARSGVDPSDPTVELSDEDVSFHLGQAGDLYQQVADRVAGDPDRGLFAINAAFGLAAVAESKGDLDRAREKYSKAASLATQFGFDALATVATDLGETAGEASEVTLYERSALPRLPFEPEPLEATTEVVEDEPSSEGPQDGASEGGNSEGESETPAEAPPAEDNATETPADPPSDG